LQKIPPTAAQTAIEVAQLQ